MEKTARSLLGDGNARGSACRCCFSLGQLISWSQSRGEHNVNYLGQKNPMDEITGVYFFCSYIFNYEHFCSFLSLEWGASN